MRTELGILILVTTCATAAISQSIVLKGQAWEHKAQEIPRRIQFEFYNVGGEGFAYHDTDSINNGSGKLNPADGTFLNEFRMKEGVDISYTKSKDIDISPYNKVAPEMNQLYLGWTEPGEWVEYRVAVKKTGTYQVGLMYTANGDGAISLDVDGKDASGELKVTSTNDPNEPIAWRQWHHWNKIDNLATISLTKGVHTLRLHTVAHGNMNYDYLEFKKIKK
jgi:hypothetical protein